MALKAEFFHSLHKSLPKTVRWDKRRLFIVLLKSIPHFREMCECTLILSKMRNSWQSLHVKRGYFRKEYLCKESLWISNVTLWPSYFPDIQAVLWEDVSCPAVMRKLLCTFLLSALQTEQKKTEDVSETCFKNEPNSGNYVSPQVNRITALWIAT